MNKLYEYHKKLDEAIERQRGMSQAEIDRAYAASTSYKEGTDCIYEQLANITNKLKAHDEKSGTVKHWGHVGDLERISELLGEIERTIQ